MESVASHCLVCGYPGIAIVEGMICPCCGTQFGCDDFEVSHEQLRREWIGSGCPWFSDNTSPQFGWNALDQMYRAKLINPKNRAA